MVKSLVWWGIAGLAVLGSAAAPQRIVSTAPSITEMLYALGLGDRVAGVTDYCHFPPEARRKAKIGSYLQPNVEVILSLRPDLVIAEPGAASVAGRLASLGVRTLEVQDEQIEGIERSLRQIGSAAGVPARAEEVIGRMQAQLRRVEQRTAAQPRRSVVFVVGRSPGTLQGMVVAGRGSYLNRLMEVAGGRNVFAGSGAAYPKVPLEELLARNPDVIVDMGDMAETDTVTPARKQAVLVLWQRYRQLKAVREGHVFPVASDLFVVPGPRVAEAALAFARMFHPEAGL